MPWVYYTINMIDLGLFQKKNVHMVAQNPIQMRYSVKPVFLCLLKKIFPKLRSIF